MFKTLLNMIPGAGPILSAGIGLVETVTGNKRERDQQGHAADMAVSAQFAAEFRQNNRNFFDSLIDGLNRLPRPVIVVMVVLYFLTAWNDPTEFQIINLALDGVPERMWIIAGVIITFFFGARELSKARDQKRMALSAEAFNEQQRRIHDLRQQKHVETGAHDAEMADETKPLSNRSIEEWNRRRRERRAAA